MVWLWSSLVACAPAGRSRIDALRQLVYGEASRVVDVVGSGQRHHDRRHRALVAGLCIEGLSVGHI